MTGFRGRPLSFPCGVNLAHQRYLHLPRQHISFLPSRMSNLSGRCRDRQSSRTSRKYPGPVDVLLDCGVEWAIASGKGLGANVFVHKEEVSVLVRIRHGQNATGTVERCSPSRLMPVIYKHVPGVLEMWGRMIHLNPHRLQISPAPRFESTPLPCKPSCLSATGHQAVTSSLRQLHTCQRPELVTDRSSCQRFWPKIDRAWR